MLLEELPELWEEADLVERRKILLTMLDAIYVDTVEERAVVALRPKPAFRALFQIATTREGSGVVLYNENPPGASLPETRAGCTGGRELGWDRDSATARPPPHHLGDSDLASNSRRLQLLTLATLCWSIQWHRLA